MFEQKNYERQCVMLVNLGWHSNPAEGSIIKPSSGSSEALCGLTFPRPNLPVDRAGVIATMMLHLSQELFDNPAKSPQALQRVPRNVCGQLLLALHTLCSELGLHCSLLLPFTAPLPAP